MSSLYDQITESGFFRSLTVIIISEIGDKTFLLAAILAMRHARILVFSGAFGALAVMSILSALLGHILPSLLPHRWTTIAASVLFLVFGAKMLQEGLHMQAGNEIIEEELKEVQKEIEESESTHHDVQMEEGIYVASTTDESLPKTKGSGMTLPTSTKESITNLLSLVFSPILIQSFIMTFLAEWGDRSQITTIALGAAHNVWIVSFGTILGHGLCTAGAVMGGKWLATKISVRNVTLGGAVLFLIFGLVYVYEAIYDVDEPQAGLGLARR